MSQQQEIIADRVLDLRGECCPYPPIYTIQELNSMASGEILEVIVDHPPSVTNVPEEVRKHGHEVLGEPIRDGAEFHLFFRVK